MKQHYLIQIPPRKSGIYLILNLLKKKAYVGLAQDFCNRALDHFKALSITKDGETTISVNQSGEIVEVEVNENINLLKETERNFLHIPIFEYVHRQYDLKDIETAFMSIVKEAGFELYNTAKINYSYPTELEPIRNELCSSLNKSLQALYLYDIDALGALEEPAAADLWNKLSGRFACSSERFVLSKEPSERYLNDAHYAKVCDILDSFFISKEKLRKLGLAKEIPTVSLIAKDKTSIAIRARMKSKIIVSNFGTHNGESPYEILTRKTMDMDIKQCGYTYWAFKKGTSIEYFTKVFQESGERDDVYILLKTTPSDNSGGYNPKPDIISSKAKDTIILDDKYKHKWNKTDLKHAFFHDNHWTLFPKKMLSVTSPRGEGRFEGMSRAFKIDKFWLCNENFDIKEKTGKQPTYPLTFDKDFFQQNFPCGDSASVIIARLKYPYIVPISHVPSLSLFLDCVDNRENLLLAEKTDDGRISRWMESYQIKNDNFMDVWHFTPPLPYADVVDAYYRNQIDRLSKEKCREYYYSCKLCYEEDENGSIITCEKFVLKDQKVVKETLLIDPSLDSFEKEPIKLKGGGQFCRIFRFYPAEPRVIIETENGKLDKNKKIKRVIFLCREGVQRKAWVYKPKEPFTIADLDGADAAHPDSNTKLWAECLDGIKTGELDAAEGNYFCKHNYDKQTAVITVTMENASDIRIALDDKMVHNCLYLSQEDPYAYYTFVQNNSSLQYSFRYRDKMSGSMSSSIFTPPFIIDDTNYIDDANYKKKN